MFQRVSGGLRSFLEVFKGLQGCARSAPEGFTRFRGSHRHYKDASGGFKIGFKRISGAFKGFLGCSRSVTEHFGGFPELFQEVSVGTKASQENSTGFQEVPGKFRGVPGCFGALQRLSSRKF